MKNVLDPKVAENLIEGLSHHYMKRPRACGLRSITREDVKSELWIAWSIARNNFNADLGVPFEPYFYNGARNHMNRFIDREMKITFSQSVSLEAPNSAGVSIADRVSSNAVSQEEAICMTQERERALLGLSKEAAAVVSLIEDTPAELEAEIVAMSARAALARSMGLAASSPRSMTRAMAMNVLGIEGARRASVNAELSALIEGK